MKDNLKEKLKRGIKKIEEINSEIEKFNEYSDPMNLLSQAKSKLEDYANLKINEIINSTRIVDEYFYSDNSFTLRGKFIEVPDYSKVINKRKVKLPKLEKKNRSKFMKMEKEINIIGCPFCGYTENSTNAMFCKNCGQRLLIFRNIGDFNSFIKNFENLLKDGVADYYLLLDLGSIYFNKAKFEKAVKAYEQYLNINPSESVIWAYLGLAYYKLTKYNEAVKAFEKACNLDSKNSTIKSFLGLNYVFNGETKKGIDICKDALKGNPKEKFALNNLSCAYNCIGEYEHAIDTARKAIELDLSNEIPWGHLSRAYLGNGDFNEAFVSIIKALERNPNYGPAWKNLGILYQINKNYSHSIDALWFSIQSEPRDYLAWFSLANSYYNLGDYEKAYEATKICLNFKSDFFEALLLYEEIVKSYKKYQNDYKTWHKLAKMFYKEKFFEKAILLSNKSLELNPDYEDSLKLLHQIEKELSI